MLETELNLLIIQTDLVWDNAESNLKNIEHKLTSHFINYPEKVDVILLPETFSTGFSMNPEKAETMNGMSMQWLAKMAALYNCCFAGSLMIIENETFYNRFIWMKNNGEYEYYDKRHLFSLSDEPTYFTQGHQRLIVECNGWKICPQICYDLRFPVWSRNNRTQPYDVLLYVANWPEKRHIAWEKLLPARAIENQAYAVGVNRIGIDNKGNNHLGSSIAFSPLGEVISTAENKAVLMHIKLSKPVLLNCRKALPFLNDADDFQMVNF